MGISDGAARHEREKKASDENGRTAARSRHSRSPRVTLEEAAAGRTPREWVEDDPQAMKTGSTGERLG